MSSLKHQIISLAEYTMCMFNLFTFYELVESQKGIKG